jgi:very-short-patch-repair endonuclease
MEPTDHQPSLITRQPISKAKLARAKTLRQEMTPEEGILWERLRKNRLDGLHFRRQQIVNGFIADFYCHPASLVVEVDGEVHGQQIEYDAERDRAFWELGLCVLHVTNREVQVSLEGVLERIRQACVDRI